MANYDDLFASTATAQPDTRPQWQIRQQRNRENAYATLDAAFQDFSEGKGDMKAYLDVQSRFDRYSARNAILIQKKRPDAQKLGDWGYWRDQGVEILRSERRNPVIILEPGKEYTREDGTTGQYYNAKEVFDISQTTARGKAQPQVSLDERLLLRALIAKPPVPILAVDQLPDAGRGAMYDPQQDAILVRKGMDAPDIFRSVSMELAHVELEAASPAYSREEQGYKAYCVSYLLCKKYGIDTASYDLSRLNVVFVGRAPKEIGAELSDIKEAAGGINARMAKVLEQSRAPRHQEQER